MAKKILILDDGSHMKKTAVEALVRRLLMFWVEPGKSATRATIRQFVEAKPFRAPLSATTYIPTKLPPAEVPGCRFLLNRTKLVNDQIPALQLIPYAERVLS